jgi:hypothetical protein
LVNALLVTVLGFNNLTWSDNMKTKDKTACCLNCKNLSLLYEYGRLCYVTCSLKNIGLPTTDGFLSKEKPCFKQRQSCNTCKHATEGTSIINTRCLKYDKRIDVFKEEPCFEPSIVYKEQDVTNCDTLLSSTLGGKPLLDGFVVPETVIIEEDSNIISVTVALRENTDILYDPVSRRLTFKYHDEV